MMKLRDDDILGNDMSLSIDDIYNPSNQADAVFTPSVSGINDATYNAFPTASAYNNGGFVQSTNPVYEAPQISVIADDYGYIQPVKSTNPVYQPEPIAVIQEPIREVPTPSYGKCMRVIFTANRGFSSTANWKDCSGNPRSQFVSVNESLEVDALDGSASGLPYMSYPIGHSPIPPAYEPVPIYEQPQPYKPPYEPVPYPVEPIDPIFLLPTNPNLIEEPIQEPIQPSTRKCYTFSLTNVSNQRYDVGFTDCCTGEAVNFSLEAGETRNNLQYETTNFNTSDLVASNIEEGCIVVPRNVAPAPLPAPTPVIEPVDEIKPTVMPVDWMPDYTPEPVPVTPVVNAPVVQPSVTPETPTALPTKTSKDLKPYIIAGIAVVGILIASRLFAKK
jgi:hypothetical protein